jgi:hypothetical protein
MTRIAEAGASFGVTRLPRTSGPLPAARTGGPAFDAMLAHPSPGIASEARWL